MVIAGVTRDGRRLRFPSLGAISGDWGGAADVGLAAVSAACRSADGRSARTDLERLVPEHFGITSPVELERLRKVVERQQAEGVHQRAEELRSEIKAGHIEQVRPDNAKVYLIAANV